MLGESRAEVGRRLSEAARGPRPASRSTRPATRPRRRSTSPPPSVAAWWPRERRAAPPVAGHGRRRGRPRPRGRGVLRRHQAGPRRRPRPGRPGRSHRSRTSSTSAWWVDGVLHLDHGTARVAEVAQLVETGVGVVYADGEGVVRSIAEDGTPTLARHAWRRHPAGLPAPASAGWRGPSPAAATSCVYDVDRRSARRVASTRAVDTAAHRLGPRAPLLPPRRQRLGVRSSPTAGRLGPRRRSTTARGLRSASVLLDVSAGAELRRDGDTLSVVQPFFGVHPTRCPAPPASSRPTATSCSPHRRRRLAMYDARTRRPTATGHLVRRRLDARRRDLHRRGARRVGRRQPRRDAAGSTSARRPGSYINSFEPATGAVHPAPRPRRRAGAGRRRSPVWWAPPWSRA